MSLGCQPGNLHLELKAALKAGLGLIMGEYVFA